MSKGLALVLLLLAQATGGKGPSPEAEAQSAAGGLRVLDSYYAGRQGNDVEARVTLFNTGTEADRLLAISAPDGVTVGEIQIATLHCGSETPNPADQAMEIPNRSPDDPSAVADRVLVSFDLLGVPDAEYSYTVVPITLTFERAGELRARVVHAVLAPPSGQSARQPGCS